MPVVFRREGSVAFVTLDNPPVNAIGLDVRRGLVDALDWVEGEDGLSRVVFSGGERMFAAGADAKEFDRVTSLGWRPSMGWHWVAGVNWLWPAAIASPRQKPNLGCQR